MWRLNPLRNTSWERLKRIMTWVIRFIENCSKQQAFRQAGELTSNDMKETEERLIRVSQTNEFSEYKDISKGKTLPKNS